MSNKFKKVVIVLSTGALLGIAFGYLVTLIVSAIFADGNFTLTDQFMASYDNEVSAFMAQTVIWTIVGVIYAACNFIWENSWGEIKQSLVAGCIYLVTILLAAFFGGWIDWSISSVIMFIVIFFGIFIAIWIVIYLWGKNNINEINKKL